MKSGRTLRINNRYAWQKMNPMLHQISIKTLYSLALAEGEGVGTAYEYFAKRLILASWLNGKPLGLSS